MKKIIDINDRLTGRSYWLIKHRWFAIIVVIFLSAIVKYVFDIDINAKAIIITSFTLIIENITSLFWLKKIKQKKEKEKRLRDIKRNINFQIIFDLIALTFLIHFSGGIENPFIVAYFFHMAIASILLPRKVTFILTTIAVFLISFTIYLEYTEIIPHYCFCIKGSENIRYVTHTNIYHIIKIMGIFVASFYILVYITSAIGQRLQKQEENYTKAIIELNRKDELKNEYVLRVTHDIKGHIGAIQSSIGIVKSGIFGKNSKKNNEFIVRAHKRTAVLIKFVKDLLKITRMRLNEEFETEIFQIKKTLLKAIDDVRENAEPKNIKLKSFFDPALGEYNGNEFSIKEITSNLMLNAIKYTPENGEILLGAYEFKDMIRVEVSDTGMGIPESDITKIFNEFYRASNVNKSVIDGTGMGLTIVKKVINRHGGEIWVESKLGEGSKFIYTLPKKTNNAN